VTLLSSLFDVPAQLALVLSLAASTAGHELPAAPAAEATAPAAIIATPETLEGPLRFGERTWLRALKEAPAEADAESYALRIFITSGGRFYIPTADERRRILEARHDSALAEALARAFAQSNARRMYAVLGRAPTAGDLYVAHVLGPEAAIALVTAAAGTPDDGVAKTFPELASALPELSGATSMTVGQFYRRLSGALHEPPRLVAIGLKPTMADAPRPHLADSRGAGTEAIAWQTEVSAANGARPIQ
jgi:hypothetical protein